MGRQMLLKRHMWPTNITVSVDWRPSRLFPGKRPPVQVADAPSARRLPPPRSPKRPAVRAGEGAIVNSPVAEDTPASRS